MRQERPPPSLRVIYEQIEVRTRAIAESSPGWPCRRGCDACCRRLPHAPELTRAEWAHLWQSYLALEVDLRRRVRGRLTALEQLLARGARHVTCPLLHPEAGTCLVYQDRPAACRMYGFYVSRGEGRYCDLVQARVEEGRCEDVIWGNHDAIDTTLSRAFGAPISMSDWFRENPDPE